MEASCLFLVRQLALLAVVVLAGSSCAAFQWVSSPPTTKLTTPTTTPLTDTCPHQGQSNRRTFLTSCTLTVGWSSVFLPVPDAQAAADLQFSTSLSGIQWADAKVGSGSPKQVGETAAVDYVLSTTGARYGFKIYSTQGNPNAAEGGFTAGAPYRWTLGDGSTIVGLEKAIVGETGMPPMLPGGVRRVILPASVAYQSLALPGATCQAGVGPVPPPSTAFEEFQRFKNIYCNPNRYQPDVVMDIKLYGRRS